MNNWKNKKVFITGVCGTVGKELFSQIIKHEPAEVIGIDNNESELFFLDEAYRDDPNINLFLGDLRDRERLIRLTRGVDVILHSAALKHVILCEKSPTDAVHTNILGVQNIIDAAMINKVQRVLFTSSDKAVNPTNVMGTSKLMGERLMTAANAQRRGEKPIFASTRFGNVLGSRGSVIPLFKKQIESGGPVTLTDPKMTRFIMTLEEAVQLVMNSTFLAKGGEVFVTKMPVVNISDLAEVMIDLLAPEFGYDPSQIEIEVIGSKPGEKLYEELVNNEETRRTLELARYFTVLPAFKSLYSQIEYDYPDVVSRTIAHEYNSAVEEAMSQEELKDFLLRHNLIQVTAVAQELAL